MLFSQKLYFVLLFVTFLSTIYLYLYPVFKGCGFPLISPAQRVRSFSDTVLSRSPKSLDRNAPFRLLAFGDPQLEGNTSIWYPSEDSYRWSKLYSNLRAADSVADVLPVLARAVRDFFYTGVLGHLKAWRKRLDLLGNDFYLAHIYRTVHWYTEPTHVAVLGDLLGSQWIQDEEFGRRSTRYWERVFRHGSKVEDNIAAVPKEESLGADKAWDRRIINIAGNHDVGYAGDLTSERVERFESAFGRVNWEVSFRIPLTSQSEEPVSAAPDDGGLPPDAIPHTASNEPQSLLRLVILNSMNLDSPARAHELQSATYQFINDMIVRSRPVEDRTIGTIVLTHIPLHKEAGTCVDGPSFDFYREDEEGVGVKGQNHLSYDASKGILEGIYGMSGNPSAPGSGLGRNGIILTGHDHEGCDVYHYLPFNESSPDDLSSRKWNSTLWTDAAEILKRRRIDIPGIREVTLRSMMGEFGGFAYMLSAWFDKNTGEWQFEVNRCNIGVQHLWWAVHALMLVAFLSGCILAFSQPNSSTLEQTRFTSRLVRSEKEKKEKNARISASKPNKSTGRQSSTRNGHLKKRIPKA